MKRPMRKGLGAADARDAIAGLSDGRIAQKVASSRTAARALRPWAVPGAEAAVEKDPERRAEGPGAAGDRQTQGPR